MCPAPSKSPLVPLFHQPVSWLNFPTGAAPVGKFSQLTGWWNSGTRGDFDGAGHMDIFAGNRGRNNKYQEHLGQPLAIYFGDLNGAGSMEMLEVYYDSTLLK